MKRLCFTITSLRSSKTIREFRELISKKLFQGIEIFYPYNLDEEGMQRYKEDIEYILKGHDDVEVVMHLPHGMENDLISQDNIKSIISKIKRYSQLLWNTL